MWCQPDNNGCFGDSLGNKANERIFRVYFQNANSIKSTRWDKWVHTCALMKTKSVDLFGLAEIGINPCFPQATEEISQIARRNWMHAVTNLTNTHQEQRGLAQRGGTSLTTTNHWVSQVVERGHDKKLGRWTYHILCGRNNHRVVFVLAY